MTWQSPTDAVPWVGLYIAVASLVCTLLMGADVVQGFRHRRLWFPCRYFTINAASMTFITIAMKLAVDLTTDISAYDNWFVRSTEIFFLFTMLVNFLPSLGGMDDKELFTNIIALGVLIVTITVDVFIKEAFNAYLPFVVAEISVMTVFLLWPFWVALAIPETRRVLQLQYQKFHTPPLVISFSSEELMRYVKKYWIMAESGNPQFVIASSPFSSASGLVCLFFATMSIFTLRGLWYKKSQFWVGQSDYRWSVNVILTVQSIGIIVGSIAPFFRSFTTATYFKLSIPWSIKHINMFRVEKHWTKRLQDWKHSHVTSHILGQRCRKVLYLVKNVILNLCIAFEITLVVICKTACLVPTCITLLFRACCQLCISLWKWFKTDSTASDENEISELEEYAGYVLQIEDGAKLTNATLRSMLRFITNTVRKSEKNQPTNLIKFLEKSIGFNGVAEFDNDRVPPLHSEETQYCWSLVIVTLTAIALALPHIANDQVKELRASMIEGLRLVAHIERTLNGDLEKVRKAGRRVWTGVELFCTWLHIDLQKKAREEKMSKEILLWLGDEAEKIVIKFKKLKDTRDDSFHNFIVASSMFRISKTVLLHCNEQENWPTDVEIFEWISTIIADVLLACFTNLPRIIILKCHQEAMEKREDSIQSAARLLGKSQKILTILEGLQLPNLDGESLAYIDKWHALG